MQSMDPGIKESLAKVVKAMEAAAHRLREASAQKELL